MLFSRATRLPKQSRLLLIFLVTTTLFYVVVGSPIPQPPPVSTFIQSNPILIHRNTNPNECILRPMTFRGRSDVVLGGFSTKDPENTIGFLIGDRIIRYYYPGIKLTSGKLHPGRAQFDAEDEDVRQYLNTGAPANAKTKEPYDIVLNLGNLNLEEVYNELRDVDKIRTAVPWQSRIQFDDTDYFVVAFNELSRHGILDGNDQIVKDLMEKARYLKARRTQGRGRSGS
ncbi:hypothetical protein EV360DRAFT_83350 [Lentinula raphanica]|nr:hypothetical protein EV360DRAFT_83350 [Lentinula raphanica]